MVFSATTALYVGNTSYSKAYIGNTQVWPKKIATITKVNTFSEMRSGNTYVLLNEDCHIIIGNHNNTDFDSLVYTDVSSGGTTMIVPPSNYTEFVFDKTFTYSSHTVSGTVAYIITKSNKKTVYLDNPTSAQIVYLTTTQWGTQDRYKIFLSEFDNGLGTWAPLMLTGAYGILNGGVTSPYVPYGTAYLVYGRYWVYKMNIITQ